MFGTKGRKEKVHSGVSPYLTYGVNLVKINRINILTALSGAKRIQLEVEGQAPEVEGFTADASATAGGQVGRASMTIWLNDTKEYYVKAIEEFQDDVAILATKLLGETDDVEAGTVATPARAKFDDDAAVDNIEDFVEAMQDHLTGEYFWMVMTGEEYEKSDGTIGVVLNKRRWGWCATEAEGENHVKPFNKEDKNDYKVWVKPDVEPELDDTDDGTDGGTDDLPF